MKNKKPKILKDVYKGTKVQVVSCPFFDEIKDNEWTREKSPMSEAIQSLQNDIISDIQKRVAKSNHQLVILQEKIKGQSRHDQFIIVKEFLSLAENLDLKYFIVQMTPSYEEIWLDPKKVAYLELSDKDIDFMVDAINKLNEQSQNNPFGYTSK